MCLNTLLPYKYPDSPEIRTGYKVVAIARMESPFLVSFLYYMPIIRGGTTIHKPVQPYIWNESYKEGMHVFETREGIVEWLEYIGRGCDLDDPSVVIKVTYSTEDVIAFGLETKNLPCVVVSKYVVSEEEYDRALEEGEY